MADRELIWDRDRTTPRSDGTDHHVPITGEQTSDWLDRWNYAVRFVHVARRRKGRAHLEVTLERDQLIIERVPDKEFDEVRDSLDTAVEVANESA